MSRYLLVFFFIMSSSVMCAQTELIISESAFLKQVLLFHPSLRNAELDVEGAEAEEMSARAAFDPVWKSEYGSKDFKSTSYYDYQHTSLEMALPPGINMKVGADRNRGDFINPELSTPSNGLAFAELSIPIGDGLFRTQELTKLQKARLQVDRQIRQLAAFRRDLTVYASEVYWNWVASNEEVALRERVIDLAEIRYRQTVTRWEQGSATAMDTLEALNNYYKRQTEFLDARANNEAWYRLAGTMVWDQNWIGRMRQGQIAADTSWYSEADIALQNPTMRDRSPLVNPILEDLDLAFSQADLNLRLARENVKPDVDVSAKLISDPALISLTSNNAIFGISAKVPILSRKERAGIQKAKIKQQQTLIKISQKERELIQKYEQFETQIGLNDNALDIAFESATNAERLLELENKRLLFGESTLFLVNRRENSFISAELKRIDVQRKQRILEWKLLMLTTAPEEILF